MDTEYGPSDHGRYGEVVEEVGDLLPDVGIAKFLEAFLVKPVDLRDLTTLVVPPEQGDAVWVADLECYQEEDRFHAVEASVHIVPEEKIALVSAADVPSTAEELDQIVELPVDVSAHSDGKVDPLYVVLG